jgi:dihydropteroate synthase
MNWNLGRRTLSIRSTPLVMGILNVTPDSFSDGGRYDSIENAVSHGITLANQGADIIDIGGESTRPYSDPVGVEEELSRVIPVIERLKSIVSIPISIDTSKAEVARQAIAAGAEIINDVSGLQGDPEMMSVAVRSNVGLCVMHMQGTPQTMQDNPTYDNIVEEIFQYLVDRRDVCLANGIAQDRLCLDPGIGFGKTHQHNIELIKQCRRFRDTGCPILIGHSRKGFIGKLIGDKEADRDAGTLGITLAVAAAGMHVVRVHDVSSTRHALDTFAAVYPLKSDD